MLVVLQSDRIEVGLVALGEAKGQNGAFFVAEENQCAIATRLASAFSRDALLDQGAAEIGVDQTVIGLVDGRDKRRVTYTFAARKLREPAILVDVGSLLTGDDQHPTIIRCIIPQ